MQQKIIDDTVLDYLQRDKIQYNNILQTIANHNIKEALFDNGVCVTSNEATFIGADSTDFIDKLINCGYFDVPRKIAGLKGQLGDYIIKTLHCDWVSPHTLYCLYDDVELPETKATMQALRPQDAEYIHDFYIFKEGYPVSKMLDDILNRDSSAIYFGDKPVSWILLHDDDTLGFLYTCEEHRGKGYAQDVTVDLIKKQRKNRQIVYAHVLENNINSHNLMKKLGFTAYSYGYWLGGVQKKSPKA